MILPNAITALVNLQVLKLEKCSALKQLPEGLKKLVNLKRLGIFGCWGLTHMPCGIGQLTNLRELSRFVVGKDYYPGSKSSGGLGELRHLNNLRGDLEIVVDEQWVKKSVSEFKEANLKEKPHLQHLTIEYNWRNNDDDDMDSYEASLEAVQPHPNLNSLEVRWHRGVKLPGWLSSLTNLTSIHISLCRKCKDIPSLHHLPSLRQLTIGGLNEVEYIENGGNWDTKGEPTLFFSSLKKLWLSHCPNLKGWWPTSSSELPHFHCLSFLKIVNCPNLTSMPQFSPLEDVELKKPSKEIVEQIFKFEPTSFKRLHIFDFPMNCGDLRHLHISDTPHLATLPEGLQHATTLLSLRIRDCSNLISLPEWLVNLTSLQSLEVNGCPQLSERYNNRTALDWPLIKHIPNIEIDGRYVQQNGRYIL